MVLSETAVILIVLASTVHFGLKQNLRDSDEKIDSIIIIISHE